MDSQVRRLSPESAFASAARIVNGVRNSGRVGTIHLLPHQVEAVDRIVSAIETHGGALLCDAVGMGKTFSAAAVMGRHQTCAVIAPAGLRSMWTAALARCGLEVPVHSLEKFSRTSFGISGAELIVIDEAHHLRNPLTIRFKRVAEFVQDSRVLLLTATPVHNRARDLAALLSLFLGHRASTLAPSDLAQCVIRRRQSALRLPKRIQHAPATPPLAEGFCDVIVGLPPPVPPRDGDMCDVLVQLTLLRQWASSDAALRDGLNRRRRRAQAMIAALEAGTFPTRKELSSWITGEDVQLGFAGFLAEPGGDAALLHTVRKHESAISNLLARMNSESPADEWRAVYLQSLRRTHPDRKIVAFTQFASTAKALFRMMRRDPGVALITAAGCEIASGRIVRTDVISRFAPIASGVAPPPRREEISLLITTDLCSEGLNLQDASVLLHLDVPWTPARIEQRIGRIARTGSAHRDVHIYSFSVPRIAEEILGMERRLREKGILSSELVGEEEHSAAGTPPSAADATQKIRDFLATLDRSPDEVPGLLFPHYTAVECDRDCFVCIVETCVSNRILSGDQASITDDPRLTLDTLTRLTHRSVTIDPCAVTIVEARIMAWLKQRSLQEELNIGLTRTRRIIARRIARTALRVPIHARSAIGTLADDARHRLAAGLSIGAELRLSTVPESTQNDDDLLRDVASLKNKTGPANGSGSKVLVLLLGRRSVG